MINTMKPLLNKHLDKVNLAKMPENGNSSIVRRVTYETTFSVCSRNVERKNVERKMSKGKTSKGKNVERKNNKTEICRNTDPHVKTCRNEK